MDSQENALVNASPVEESAKEEVKVEETVNETPAAPEVEVEKVAEVTAEPVAEEAAPAKGEAEPAAEEAAPAVEAESAPVEERKVYQTKQEVLDRVKEIAHGDEAPKKDEVEYLKTAFYKLHIAEREAQMKE